MTKLRVLDLFSGIGGFSLGLERTGGFETVAFCEIEEFPRKVLKKHWPEVPQFDDVRKLKGSDVGAVDVICGGYPCQPFSTAGKRRGHADDRHLWPEFNRLVAELRPTWVIGENVAGHISMGLDDVLSDLEGQGYACRTFVIPACAVDAKHRRDRCWTLACAESERSEKRTTSAGVVGHSERQSELDFSIGTRNLDGVLLAASGRHQEANAATRPSSLADNDIQSVPRREEPRSDCRRRTQPHDKYAGGCCGGGERLLDSRGSNEWLPEPRVGRMAHGIPRRVDRLRALGNAVVPQIPELIGHAILEATCSGD